MSSEGSRLGGCARRLTPGNQEDWDNKGNGHYETARILEKAK